MLEMVKKILPLTALSCVLMVGGVERAGAETSQFDQNQGYDRGIMNATGGGYQVGAYDLNAIQPAEAGVNWNGKSRFTGISKLTDETLLSQWTIQMLSKNNYSYSSPVIGADGTIYVADNQYPTATLYALSPNGTRKWEYSIGDGINSSPTIGADGTIYVNSRSSYDNVHAINPDGTRRWVYSAWWTYDQNSPAIGADGTVYIGASDSLHAIKSDGTRKYMFRTDDTVICSPAIASDGTVFVGSISGKFYAINPDGTEKWSYNTQSRIDGGVTIGADGTIYVGSTNRLYAFSQQGTVKWIYTAGSSISSSPAVESDGTIYFNSGDLLYALNSDGTEKWKYNKRGSSLGSPLIGADGTVYITTSFYPGLDAVNATGTRKWRFNMQSTSYFVAPTPYMFPALGADGTLYVGHGQYFYAIGRHHLAPNQDDFSDQQMHIQADNGTSADITFDNNYPSDIIDDGILSGNMLQWQVSTDGVNFTGVVITFVDGKLNQARVSNLYATKGYQIRTLYRNKQGRQMVYQRVILRPDKYTGKPLPTADDFQVPYGQEPNQPPAIPNEFLASAGFSDTQSGNNWYYKEWKGSMYFNMTWDRTNNWWKGSNDWTLIGSHWHHADRDTARIFAVPKDGTIRITGKVAKSSTGGGNGVNVKVMKNNTQLWPEAGWQHIAFDDATGYNLDLTTTVTKGDGIYFIVNQDVDDYDLVQGEKVNQTSSKKKLRVNKLPADGVNTSGGDLPEGLYDSVIWDPLITYQP